MEDSTIPSSKNYTRDYRQEAKTAKRRGENKDNASRKRARRKYIRLHGEAAARGKDIDHADRNPKNNGKKNLKAKSASANRSFSRKRNSKKYGNGK